MGIVCGDREGEVVWEGALYAWGGSMDVCSADGVRCRSLETPQDDTRESRIEPEDLSDPRPPLLFDSRVPRRCLVALGADAPKTSFISLDLDPSGSGNGFVAGERWAKP